ncbi:hypothetical protein [Actinotalea sp.]|uniref:hypothetical protein n=1 Tax=Actinotalea sp. TaxID=1872145 RepID=UPI0035642D5E
MPTRWRVALAAVGVTMIAPAPRPDSRAPLWWSRWRRRAEPPPDPFAALEIQLQLARVSAQLRALYSEPRIWARGSRVIATQAAYDSLLATACRLAGVETREEDTVPGLTRSDDERTREELELLTRGWAW